jgi:hypothetical protein
MLTVHFDKVTIVFNTNQIKISSPETVDSIYFNKFTSNNIKESRKMACKDSYFEMI